MKKFFTGLFLIGLFFTSSAQSKDEKGIRSDLATYIELTENQQFDALMDYVHPKVFDIVSRELMVETFESIFNDPSMEFKFNGFKINKIYPTVKNGKEKYALVDYQSGMNMKMIGEEFTDEVLEASKTMFEAQFGAANVEQLADKSFQISAPKTMIATYFKDDKRWKFIEQNTQMQGILDSAIPTDVQEALNRTKYEN